MTINLLISKHHLIKLWCVYKVLIPVPIDILTSRLLKKKARYQFNGDNSMLISQGFQFTEAWNY